MQESLQDPWKVVSKHNCAATSTVQAWAGFLSTGVRSRGAICTKRKYCWRRNCSLLHKQPAACHWHAAYVAPAPMLSSNNARDVPKPLLWLEIMLYVARAVGRPPLFVSTCRPCIRPFARILLTCCLHHSVAVQLRMHAALVQLHTGLVGSFGCEMTRGSAWVEPFQSICV